MQIILFAHQVGMTVNASAEPATVDETDINISIGRHPISRILKRRLGQEGLPLNTEILGDGLELHTDGTIRVKVLSGGFLIRDDTNGLSVDESILAPLLSQQVPLKRIQQEIDGLRAMAWSGIN